jgi:cell division septum initiation protein DivIVA
MHAAAFASVLLVIAGCEDKKVQEALESSKIVAGSANAKLADVIAKGKGAVIEAAKNQAQDLDQIIAEFKTKAARLSGDAKISAEKTIAKLEANRASLKQKMEPLTNAQGEGWKEIAKEYDDVVTQMRNEMDELRAKLK